MTCVLFFNLIENWHTLSRNNGFLRFRCTYIGQDWVGEGIGRVLRGPLRLFKYNTLPRSATMPKNRKLKNWAALRPCVLVTFLGQAGGLDPRGGARRAMQAISASKSLTWPFQENLKKCGSFVLSEKEKHYDSQGTHPRGSPSRLFSDDFRP